MTIEEEENESPPISSSSTLQPLFVYGVNFGVQGSIHFSEDQLLYPVGAGIAILDTNSKVQRVMTLSKRGCLMTAWTVSLDRRLVCISEKSSSAALVTIIDVHSGKKERSLRCAPAQSDHVVALAFSSDAKFLLAQTGPPDYTLFYFFWSKGKILTCYTPSSKLPVSSVSFHPKENNVVCVVGQGCFRMLRLNEGNLKGFGYAKGDHHVMLAHDWMHNDHLVIGTKGGKLLFLYEGELKHSVRVSDLLLSEHHQSQHNIMGSAGSSVISEESYVHCVHCFKRGVIVSLGTSGCVLVLRLDKLLRGNEENNDIKLKIQYSLRISPPKGVDLAVMGYKLVAMAVDNKEKRLVGLTDTMQLVSTTFQDALSASLATSEASKGELTVLVHLFHHGPIIGLDICPRRPIAVTCGEDQTVRVWNYSTLKPGLCQRFDEAVFSVALHPSGLYVACGFSGRLRFLSLMVRELGLVHEWHLRSVHLSRFSHGGHLLAAVNETQDIFVFCTISFSTKMCLKGHRGKVGSLVFSEDDLSLVSCGMDGVLYEFDLTNGQRKFENVVNECGFNDVLTLSGQNALRQVVLAGDKSIKVFEKDHLLTSLDLHTTNLASMVRGIDQVFCGSAQGQIVVMPWPLKPPLHWKQFELHGDLIVKLKMAVDKKRLISVSRDGSMCVWNIEYSDNDGGREEHKYAEETLISYQDLRDSEQLIADLKQQVEETRTERDYQLRLKSNAFAEELKAKEDEFSQELSEKRSSIKDLEEKLREAQKTHQITEKEMRSEFELKLNESSTHFKEKLIIEYDKVKGLEEKLKGVEEDYKEQLEQERKRKKEEIDKIKQEMLLAIEAKEKETLAREEGAERQVAVVTRVLQDTELDADKELLELRSLYEQQLRSLREEAGQQKSDIGLLQKKYETALDASEEHRQQEARLSSERSHQSAVIRALEKSVGELKKEVRLRDNVIGDKEQSNAEIRAELLDKERRVFVLQHKLDSVELRLSETQGQKEVSDEDKERKNSVEDKKGDTEPLTQEHKLTLMRRRIAVLRSELSRQSQKCQILFNARRNLFKDLENLKASLKDERELRTVAKRICEKHGIKSHKVISLEEVIVEDNEDENITAAMDELLEQNSRLQKVNERLRNQLEQRERLRMAERKQRLRQLQDVMQQLERFKANEKS